MPLSLSWQQEQCIFVEQRRASKCSANKKESFVSVLQQKWDWSRINKSVGVALTVLSLCTENRALQYVVVVYICYCSSAAEH